MEKLMKKTIEKKLKYAFLAEKFFQHFSYLKKIIYFHGRGVFDFRFYFNISFSFFHLNVFEMYSFSFR